MKLKLKKSGNKKLDTGRMVIRILLLIATIIIVLFAVIYGVGKAAMAIGGHRLYKNATSQGPTISEVMDEDVAAEDATANAAQEEELVWEEGWIRYNGKIYEYNDEILTFLILGIDKDGKVKESKNGVSGGQSDLILLAVANPKTEEIKLIAVNRDTMVDVNMAGIGVYGEDVTVTAQLSVQHGFGDGKEKSCELTRDAVSKLFYDLPIHGYLSFNYGGFSIINKAIGGVEITMPSDWSDINPKWTEGNTVTIASDKDVYAFIRSRDITEFESSRDRLSRQKTYLTSFAKKAIEATKADITFPISLFTKAKDYIVTDLSVDELSYLAGTLSGYSFSENSIYTLEGETKMGEKFEEFYPDMDALKDLMFEVFYTEVK